MKILFFGHELKFIEVQVFCDMRLDCTTSIQSFAILIQRVVNIWLKSTVKKCQICLNLSSDLNQSLKCHAKIQLTELENSLSVTYVFLPLEDI